MFLFETTIHIRKYSIRFVTFIIPFDLLRKILIFGHLYLKHGKK